jgi:hypothetical protein
LGRLEGPEVILNRNNEGNKDLSSTKPGYKFSLENAFAHETHEKRRNLEAKIDRLQTLIPV